MKYFCWSRELHYLIVSFTEHHPFGRFPVFSVLLYLSFYLKIIKDRSINGSLINGFRIVPDMLSWVTPVFQRSLFVSLIINLLMRRDPCFYPLHYCIG